MSAPHNDSDEAALAAATPTTQSLSTMPAPSSLQTSNDSRHSSGTISSAAVSTSHTATMLPSQQQAQQTSPSPSSHGAQQQQQQQQPAEQQQQQQQQPKSCSDSQAAVASTDTAAHSGATEEAEETPSSREYGIVRVGGLFRRVTQVKLRNFFSGFELTGQTSIIVLRDDYVPHASASRSAASGSMSGGSGGNGGGSDSSGGRDSSHGDGSGSGDTTATTTTTTTTTTAAAAAGVTTTAATATPATATPAVTTTTTATTTAQHRRHSGSVCHGGTVAFVTLKSVDEARRAAEALHRRYVGNMMVDVTCVTAAERNDEMRQYRRRRVASMAVFMLRGLPYASDERDVRQFVASVPDVRRVDVCRCRDGNCTGFAFVEVSSQAGANAMRQLHGQYMPGRFIEVFRSSLPKRKHYVRYAAKYGRAQDMWRDTRRTQRQTQQQQQQQQQQQVRRQQQQQPPTHTALVSPQPLVVAAAPTTTAVATATQPHVYTTPLTSYSMPQTWPAHGAVHVTTPAQQQQQQPHVPLPYALPQASTHTHAAPVPPTSLRATLSPAPSAAFAHRTSNLPPPPQQRQPQPQPQQQQPPPPPTPSVGVYAPLFLTHASPSVQQQPLAGTDATTTTAAAVAARVPAVAMDVGTSHAALLPPQAVAAHYTQGQHDRHHYQQQQQQGQQPQQQPYHQHHHHQQPPPPSQHHYDASSHAPLVPPHYAVASSHLQPPQPPYAPGGYATLTTPHTFAPAATMAGAATVMQATTVSPPLLQQQPPSSHGMDYHVVRVRGLPYDATDDMLAAFLHNVDILPHGIHRVLNHDSRFTGEAYVYVRTHRDKRLARRRHHKYIGERYVEVLPSSHEEVLRNRFVRPLTHMPYSFMPPPPPPPASQAQAQQQQTLYAHMTRVYSPHEEGSEHAGHREQGRGRGGAGAP